MVPVWRQISPLPPGVGVDASLLSLVVVTQSLPCPASRDGPHHPPVCDLRPARHRRTSNCVALRQGRSPSREATFLQELDRSQPVRRAISSFKVALSRGRGGQPGIIPRPYRDHGPHLGVRLAQRLMGTRLHMRDPLHAPLPPGGPFHRTLIGEPVRAWRVAMAAHEDPGRAQRDAMVVHLAGGPRGPRVVAPTRIEGNDGRDGVGLEKLGDAVGIEATVVDDRTHGDRQGVGGTGLEELVETGRSHGKIGDMAWGNPDLYGQGMLGGDHTVLKGARAEKVRVPVGVIAPGGRRVAVVALMIAAEDPLGATVAGGPPVGGHRWGAPHHPHRAPERGGHARGPAGPRGAHHR